MLNFFLLLEVDYFDHALHPRLFKKKLDFLVFFGEYIRLFWEGKTLFELYLDGILNVFVVWEKLFCGTFRSELFIILNVLYEFVISSVL